MTRVQELAEPTRLSAEQGPYAELLRAANEQYAEGLCAHGKLARWLSTDVARRSRRRRARAFSFSFAVAAALALAAVAGLWLRSGEEQRTERARAAAQRAASPAPGAVELGRAAAPPDVASPPLESVALAVGQTRLADGSRVRVEPSSSARLRSLSRATEVAVERGKVSFEIEPQAPDHRFQVRAAAYRFTVIGTAFSVSELEGRVVLEVQEGRVEVSRADEVLATLGAGQRWTSDAPEAARAPSVRSREPHAVSARPAPLASSTQAPAVSAVDCLALARAKRAREAESCFREQASKPGISGEMALFELARLRGDVLSDPSGALQALDEHRQRFPRGSLRAEVDMSHVELLARLGHRQEALAESARLLATDTGRERGVELHMLRGGIYRNALKDLLSAELEYAAAERAGGARSGDAAYQRGVCLEELGEVEGARAAYRRYLAVPGRKREAEARSRLMELER